MSIKQLFLVAVLATGFTTSVQAADVTHNFDFKAAVDRAVADGTLDGTVKFYLKGNKYGGKVLEQDIVTNPKPMALVNRLKLHVTGYFVPHLFS